MLNVACNPLLYVCRDDMHMICRITGKLMMKKFIVGALCALGLFAASAVVLNGDSTPVLAGGGGYGIVIK